MIVPKITLPLEGFNMESEPTDVKQLMCVESVEALKNETNLADEMELFESIDLSDLLGESESSKNVEIFPQSEKEKQLIIPETNKKIENTTDYEVPPKVVDVETTSDHRTPSKVVDAETTSDHEIPLKVVDTENIINYEAPPKVVDVENASNHGTPSKVVGAKNTSDHEIPLKMVGKEISFLITDMIIGSNRQFSDCLIVNSKISRRHCQITTRLTGAYIEDLGSTNGTFVNGKKLGPGEVVKLLPRDHVVLANMTFEIKEEK